MHQVLVFAYDSLNILFYNFFTDIIVPGTPSQQDKTFVISEKRLDHLELTSDC